MSGKQAYLKVSRELEQLPLNWELTRDLCDPKLFCRILIIDGKYIGVKGFEKKIPFIYAIDYVTHDVIHGDVFTAEDEASFSQFFSKLKAIGYQVRVVVADDRAGLKTALLKVFPAARLQLCHNHYLENIRKTLKVRTEGRYQHFFNSLRLHVFKEGISEETITQGLLHVQRERTHGVKLLEGILLEIHRRREDLFAYLDIPDCPNNTNLIELYNSHANGRLESIKGFQTTSSAKRWCNALMIRRRTKPFTDCDTPFKHLNKHCSLEYTIKKTARWPTILTKLGIRPIKSIKISVQEAPER